MDIEQAYRAAHTLTQQMLAAATAQDWDTLTTLEAQRGAVLGATPPLATLKFPPAASARLAQLIADMQRDGAEILEQVQTWQEHARILLRMDAVAP